jgi:DNA-binding HxlR family transcriptional regulator/putative sterol carrier protein
VSERGYGQFCGFARALEIVGDRWALMIVRDLLVGPKRFSDLHAGLPKIPTNVLTARLKQLEAAGVAQRRALPRPPGGVVYELTPRGSELEEAVVAMGRWGAKLLDAPRDGEIVTVDSLAMALRTTFRPGAAGDLRAGYELRIGDIVLHAIVDGSHITVGRGPLEKPDLIVEATPAIKDLMAREMTPRQALASGVVRIKGSRRLFDGFAQIFRI